jgi:hypothetical protein
MPLTPEQRRTRDRVESLIRLMAPGLNLILAAGERLSKVVAPEDDEYYPLRTRLPDPEPAAKPLEPADR